MYHASGEERQKDLTKPGGLKDDLQDRKASGSLSFLKRNLDE